MRTIINSFLIFIISSFPILPCMCGFEHPSDAYQRADLIFVGLSIPAGEDSLSFDNPGPKMRFKIEKLYKGDEEDEVEIYSDWSSCGLYLPSGYRFLVYASISKDGKYYTGKCTRTEFISGAAVDLLFLDGLPETLQQTSIVGHIYNYEDATKDYWDLPPFRNISVKIFNEKNAYESNTDENGIYKFFNIEPGKYSFIFGVSNKYTTQFSYDKTFEIKQNEFQEVDKILVPNGIICGNLTDINGKPLQRVFVEILPLDTLVRTSGYIMDNHSFIDSSGHFHFDCVPPGEYYIGINIRDKNPNTLRYIKAYYPSADSMNEAQKILVAFGDSIGGLQFRLPSDKGIFYLKGKVLFEDSTLRIGGKVQLRTSSDPMNSELIEESTINVYSKFSMMLLDGMEGWIHFDVSGLYPKSENNPETEIPEPFPYKADYDIIDLNITIRKKIK